MGGGGGEWRGGGVGGGGWGVGGGGAGGALGSPSLTTCQVSRAFKSGMYAPATAALPEEEVFTASG